MLRSYVAEVSSGASVAFTTAIFVMAKTGNYRITKVVCSLMLLSIYVPSFKKICRMNQKLLMGYIHRYDGTGTIKRFLIRVTCVEQ
jgi:hypothetical protein